MAKKVILKDDNIEIMPITRGELVLDSSGQQAFHSSQFLATDSQPGLMSKEDKYKLDHLEDSGPGADNKVAQINTTTNDVYRLLFSETADDTDRTEGSRKSANLTFNPSTRVLNLTGTINANGGTFIGTSGETFRIDRTNEGTAYVSFWNNKVIRGYLGVNPSGEPVFANRGGTAFKIWNEDNDGHGSGLDADTLDGLQPSNLYVAGISEVYKENIDFKKGHQKLQIISTTSEGALDKGFPNRYVSGLSIISDYVGWQMVTYGGSDVNNPFFRKLNDNNVWSDWKQLAFTDSNITGNAASADKLKNKVKIWGQDFDGSSDVNGVLTTNAYVTFNKTGYELGYIGLASSKNDDIYISSSGNLYINGNEDTFINHAGGNVGIGTTSARAKLDVNGEIYANPYIKFVDSRRYCGYFSSGKYLELHNDVGQVGIHLFDDGNAYVYKSGSRHTIWHAGNDGSGSGLDADLLDGYHEYSFLRYRDLGSNGGATLWSQIGIRSYHNALPEGLSGLYSYGQVVSLPGSGSRLDIFTNHVGSSESGGQGGLWWRSGWNDDKRTWRRIIDSGNIANQSVSYATSAGNADTVDNLHASDFVRAYGTYGTSYSYDSDWGQSIVTFDPIVSGTAPAQNPNITILNLGNAYYRRKQLAFTYSTNDIYYRRRLDSSWSGWVRLAISGESYTKGDSDGRYYPISGNVNMSGDNKWIGSTMGGGGTDYWRIGGSGTSDNGVCQITIGDNSNDYFQIVIADYTGTNYTALQVKAGGTYAPHFYENSDQRLKTNIQAILNKDNIPQIKEFDWKESGEHSYGLIAQELEEQGYSELVSTKDDGYKTVNYSAALSLIVGKLQVKIKELEKEIEIIKNKN